MLLAGYEIAYVPEAVVRHSHRYTLAATFKRYFDQGAAAERSYMAGGRSSPRSVRGEGVSFVRRELDSLWRNGERSHVPYALAHEAIRFAAFQLGIRHRLVPRLLRARLSRTGKSYWSRSGTGGPPSS